MGKINFHVIWNEDHSDSFIGASLKEVLNSITCDQFCKAIRRAVHLSIAPSEYTIAPSYVIKEVKREIFPEVSKKSLTAKYHYWRQEADENTIGRSLGYFFYDYRNQHIIVSLVISFRVENKKMVAHTEYSASIADDRYTDTTVEGIVHQLRNAIDENIELYEKLKAKYDPQPKLKKQDDGLWSHNSIKAPVDLVEKLKNAPTMTMEELERACELPDGTYDDI